MNGKHLPNIFTTTALKIRIHWRREALLYSKAAPFCIQQSDEISKKATALPFCSVTTGTQALNKAQIRLALQQQQMSWDILCTEICKDMQSNKCISLLVLYSLCNKNNIHKNTKRAIHVKTEQQYLMTAAKWLICLNRDRICVLWHGYIESQLLYPPNLTAVKVISVKTQNGK